MGSGSVTRGFYADVSGSELPTSAPANQVTIRDFGLATLIGDPLPEPRLVVALTEPTGGVWILDSVAR
jgi:hypothetical protein